MRQQVTKDLYAYWNRLKGARAAPDRTDIDPGQIRHILADTFIIEIDAAGVFPLRLSGARVNALWRRDQKGASFIDLWREQDRAVVTAALMTVIEGVTPVVAGVKAHSPEVDPLEMELLLAPLRHFGKTHSRVLGALTPSQHASWLGQHCVADLELVSLRMIDATAGSRGKHLASRAAEASASRPRLVVYNGDKR